MYLWTIVWFTALNDVQYEKPPIKTLQNVCRSYNDGLKLHTKLIYFIEKLHHAYYLLEEGDSSTFVGTPEYFSETSHIYRANSCNHNHWHKHDKNLPWIGQNDGFYSTLIIKKKLLIENCDDAFRSNLTIIV